MSTIPLSNIQETVERTLFNRILEECIDKGYSPDVTNMVLYPDGNAMVITFSTALITDNTINMDINGVSMAEVVFDTDHATTMGLIETAIEAISGIESVDATGNIITVIPEEDTEVTLANEAVTNGLTQPTISSALSDAEAGQLALEAAYTAIKASMGFAIEIFNHAPSQSRGMKKIPRIVLDAQNFLPGAIGGGQLRRFRTVEGSLESYKLPPQTKDYYIGIYILTNSTKQSRILNSLVALACPVRGYIDTYRDDGDAFHIEQVGYTPYEQTQEGIRENMFSYKITDVYEVGEEISEETPITEITVDYSEVEGAPNIEDQVIN